MFLSRTALLVSFVLLALPFSSAETDDTSGLPSSLEGTMTRCGLTPKLLTAAGVPAAAIETVLIGASVPMLDGGKSTLTEKDVAISDAARELTTLRRAASGEAASQDVADSIAQLQSEITILQEARDGLLMEFFQAGLSATSEHVQPIAQVIRSNASRGVPTEFMVLDRSKEEWLLIRRCLTNERTSEEVGLDPDQELQALLTDFRATPQVSLANTLLNTNLVQVKAVWRASFEG